MKAAVYSKFRGPIAIETVADPSPEPGAAVVGVRANGVCRSDWHGWAGHDPDIVVPHVPGHEIAGVVEAVGPGVARWRPGDRVAIPFIAGCGRCGACRRGQQQVCSRQYQPGFHGWGGFAERVLAKHADLTLVGLPEAVDFVAAAGLGCRFATAFRAVRLQGRASGGDWVAVHGCGGVGLAAVMIARALGANPIAVDIRPEALEMARKVGAEAVVQAGSDYDVAGAVREIAGGGAHVSLDAVGGPDVCFDSVACLRRRGRHVQVGLLGSVGRAAVPMDRVVAWELEIVGSHGLQAHEYDRVLRMVAAGLVDPGALVTRTVSLAEGARILQGMDEYRGVGLAVIDRFD